MVDQATIGANGSPRTFGRNVSGFAHDVATLAELQIRLLGVDMRDASRQMGPAAALMAVAGILALATLPVLLAAAAMLLVESADWSVAAAFGLVALVSLMISGGLAWWAWRRVATAGAIFQRSKSEFSETLHWVRESLRPRAPDAAEP